MEKAGEPRFQIIGMTRKLLLLLVVFVEPGSGVIRIVWARRRLIMKKASTTTNSVRKLKISEATKRMYRERDPALDKDADAPQLPPSYWAGASIGKYYRPLITKFWIG